MMTPHHCHCCGHSLRLEFGFGDTFTKSLHWIRIVDSGVNFEVSDALGEVGVATVGEDVLLLCHQRHLNPLLFPLTTLLGTVQHHARRSAQSLRFSGLLADARKSDGNAALCLNSPKKYEFTRSPTDSYSTLKLPYYLSSTNVLPVPRICCGQFIF